MKKQPTWMKIIALWLIDWTWCDRQASHGRMRRNATIAMIITFLVIATVNNSQSAESPPSVKWIKQVGTSERDALESMTIDDADNLYVAGYTFGNWASTNAGSSDVLIAKYDSNGKQCWAQQFGSSYSDGGAIAWDGATSLYIAGSWQSWDYHLSKSSIDGTLFWTKKPIDFPYQSNVVRSLKIAGDGSVYVCGEYGPLIKHTKDGTALWAVDIRGGRDMVLDKSGNVYMTGYSNNTGMFLDKVSPSGTVLWSKIIGKGQSGDAIAISPLDDALYVAGSTGSASINKYDMLGNLLWTRTFAGNGEISGAQSQDLAVDASGNVYVTGYTYGDLAAASTGSQDIFLRKYDPMGNDLWTWQYGTALDDIGMALALGKQGNIYICGSINPYNTEGDGLIIAFVPEPSTFVLLVMGTFGLCAYTWRRRKD